MANIIGIIKQIKRKIGSRNWNNLSYETKYILIKDEIKTFNAEMIRVFGSLTNYHRWWLKKQGLRKIDYMNWIAQQQGFKGQKEWLDEKYRAKGFKDKPDRDRFYRLRKKYHRSISDFDVREIQLKKEKMREVKKELQEFIIIRKSMRYRSKMETVKSVMGSKNSSIHPTIGVCGKNPRGTDESIRDQSNGIDFCPLTRRI